MSTIEEIRQKYAEKCALLGDLVVQQRRLHSAAEHAIREIEQLEQDARALANPVTEAPAASEAT